MTSVISLPVPISDAITSLLQQGEKKLWLQRAEKLHQRYFTKQKESWEDYLVDSSDALAYLALRAPATFSQIFSALTQVQEVVPSFFPKTVLDIGSGPGIGVWAAKEAFETIDQGTCIDKNQELLSIGKTIAQKADIHEITSLLVKDIRYGLGLEEEDQFDLTIISSVLNELPIEKGEQLLRRAMHHTKGILLLIEPGTADGNTTISYFSKIWEKEAKLLAPYIDSTFVADETYWIHFNQRFQRPQFQRTLRQRMRERQEMASDFEDTKYSYVAISRESSQVKAWGRCIGPVKIQKGFLEVPILTKEKIEVIKVMKRNKEQYTFAKNLSWGDLIKDETLLYNKTDN